jgi:hypothetical protein
MLQSRLSDDPATRARRAIVLDEIRHAAAGGQPFRDALFRWEEQIGLRAVADMLCTQDYGGYPPPENTQEVALLLGRPADAGECMTPRAILLARHGAAIRRAQELWATPAFRRDVIDVLGEDGFSGVLAALLAPALLCDYIHWAIGYGTVVEPDLEMSQRLRAEAEAAGRLYVMKPGRIIDPCTGQDLGETLGRVEDETVLQEIRSIAVKPAPHQRHSSTPCVYAKPCPLISTREAPTRTLSRPIDLHFEAGTPEPEALAEARRQILEAARLGCRRRPRQDTSYLRQYARWYVEVEVYRMSTTYVAEHYVHPRRDAHGADAEYSPGCGCNSKVRYGIQTVGQVLATDITEIALHP